MVSQKNTNGELYFRHMVYIESDSTLKASHTSLLMGFFLMFVFLLFGFNLLFLSGWFFGIAFMIFAKMSNMKPRWKELDKDYKKGVMKGAETI